MSGHNPLDVHDDAQQQRIRDRAYQLWTSEGRPEGRSDEFWERARFLIGIEENPDAGTMPPEAKHDVVEEASLQENLGEFPDRRTDQGDHFETPSKKARQTIAS